jgi:hypothetical protein
MRVVVLLVYAMPMVVSAGCASREPPRHATGSVTRVSSALEPAPAAGARRPAVEPPPHVTSPTLAPHETWSELFPDAAHALATWRREHADAAARIAVWAARHPQKLEVLVEWAETHRLEPLGALMLSHAGRAWNELDAIARDDPDGVEALLHWARWSGPAALALAREGRLDAPPARAPRASR